jgi:hypothetical protein
MYGVHTLFVGVEMAGQIGCEVVAEFARGVGGNDRLTECGQKKSPAGSHRWTLLR